jgi:hypothetical protein
VQRCATEAVTTIRPIITPTPTVQWGSSVVTKGDKWAQTGHYTDSRGTVAGARTSEGGRVVAGNGKNGSGFVGQGGGGDVYAAKDGNVYKRTDNGWQQYENGGWNSVDTSGAKTNAQQRTQNAGVAKRQGAKRSSLCGYDQSADGHSAVNYAQARPLSRPPAVRLPLQAGRLALSRHPVRSSGTIPFCVEVAPQLSVPESGVSSPIGDYCLGSYWISHLLRRSI